MKLWNRTGRRSSGEKLSVLRIREDVHRSLFRAGRSDHQSREQTLSQRSARASFFYLLLPQRRTKIEMVADHEGVTSAGEDSSTDDDNASQTTEDDPQVPQPQPPTDEHPNRPPPASTTLRDSPRYELTHTMSGHIQSISAVKFSPDGTLLASCCVCRSNPLDAWTRKVLRYFFVFVFADLQTQLGTNL